MTTPDHTRLKSIKGIGDKRAEHILKTLTELHKSVNDFFAMSAGEISQLFNLPKNIAEAVSAVAKMPVVTIQSTSEPKTPEAALVEKKVQILKRDDSNYPEHLIRILGDKSPATLYTWGNLDLLNRPAVGFCGSRNVSEKGIAVTADTAQQIVEMGWVVVSGHARGVDTTAHRTALEHNGSTIIIAAEGILNFKLRQELKKIAKPEQILIVSEFAPQAHWTMPNAMTRNKTIIGLSDAMILVEARSEGGTFEAGKAALRLNVPLYVAHYENPGESAAGNTYFLTKGARPLQKSEETGRANLQHLKASVNRNTDHTEQVLPVEMPEQMSLL